MKKRAAVFLCVLVAGCGANESVIRPGKLPLPCACWSGCSCATPSAAIGWEHLPCAFSRREVPPLLAARRIRKLLLQAGEFWEG